MLPLLRSSRRSAYHALMTNALDRIAPIVIVGGGLVGSSLALALDRAGIECLLVEAAAPRPAGAQAETRNLALARATVNGLRTIGLWSFLAASAQPITRIRVSRAGAFGSVQLDAAEAGVDALGWTVPARVLGDVLEEALKAASHVNRMPEARLVGMGADPAGYALSLETSAGSRDVRAGLLVGADGTNSSVRAMLGIQAHVHDYRQSLIVGEVRCARQLGGGASERFTAAGPVALLPLPEFRAGLVLGVATEHVGQVMALDDRDFLAYAQARLGWQAGRLVASGARQAWPIRRVLSSALTAPRAVLVGNAAQTVHPVAAQGFNLGLRDALTLAELLVRSNDLGAAALLDAYASRRADDRVGVLRMTHALATLACGSGFSGLQSLALMAMDGLPLVRRRLLRHGMGWRGMPPRAVLEALP